MSEKSGIRKKSERRFFRRWGRSVIREMLLFQGQMSGERHRPDFNVLSPKISNSATFRSVRATPCSGCVRKHGPSPSGIYRRRAAPRLACSATRRPLPLGQPARHRPGRLQATHQLQADRAGFLSNTPPWIFTPSPPQLKHAEDSWSSERCSHNRRISD